MNARALRNLSAQKQPTEKDVLEFGARIKSEHVFESINEAIEWIDAYGKGTYARYFEDSTVTDQNITLIEPDPVLTMNALDDAICTIIYDLFIINAKDDIDTEAYYRNIIDNFLSRLSKYRIACLKGRKHGKVLTQLYNMMVDLSHLAFPNLDEPNEEIDYGKMTKDYYCLMYFFCCTVKPYTRYFTDMKKFYAARVKELK